MSYRIVILVISLNILLGNITLASTQDKQQEALQEQAAHKSPQICTALSVDAGNFGDTLYAQWNENKGDFDAAFNALSQLAGNYGHDMLDMPQNEFMQCAYGQLYKQATHDYELMGRWSIKDPGGPRSSFYQTPRLLHGSISFGCNRISHIEYQDQEWTGSTIVTSLTAEGQRKVMLSLQDILLLLAANNIAQKTAESTSGQDNEHLKVMGDMILRNESIQRLYQKHTSADEIPLFTSADEIPLFLLSTILVKTNPLDERRKPIIEKFRSYFKKFPSTHDSFTATLYLESLKDNS